MSNFKIVKNDVDFARRDIQFGEVKVKDARGIKGYDSGFIGWILSIIGFTVKVNDSYFNCKSLMHYFGRVDKEHYNEDKFKPHIHDTKWVEKAIDKLNELLQKQAEEKKFKFGEKEEVDLNSPQDEFKEEEIPKDIWEGKIPKIYTSREPNNKDIIPVFKAFYESDIFTAEENKHNLEVLNEFIPLTILSAKRVEVHLVSENDICSPNIKNEIKHGEEEGSGCHFYSQYNGALGFAGRDERVLGFYSAYLKNNFLNGSKEKKKEFLTAVVKEMQRAIDDNKGVKEPLLVNKPEPKEGKQEAIVEPAKGEIPKDPWENKIPLFEGESDKIYDFERNVGKKFFKALYEEKVFDEKERADADSVLNAFLPLTKKDSNPVHVKLYYRKNPDLDQERLENDIIKKCIDKGCKFFIEEKKDGFNVTHEYKILGFDIQLLSDDFPKVSTKQKKEFMLLVLGQMEEAIKNDKEKAPAI